MEASRPLTNRFLVVWISQLQTQAKGQLQIIAQLDTKQQGQVSYMREAMKSNSIELKLQPISGGIIQQNLLVGLFEFDANGNGQPLGQSFTQLNACTPSLLNLQTYGSFAMPIAFSDNEGRQLASCWLNLSINNRNFDFNLPANNLNIELLPKHDPSFKFEWRVRVDVRTAVGLPTPMNTFVECHWTMSDNSTFDANTKENFYEIYRTKMRENNANPFYNTQFLVVNPYYKFGAPAYTQLQGYLAFRIKDSNWNTFDEVYFPIASLKPFQPLNLELTSTRKDLKVKPKYYLSLTLEQQPKDGKGLCDIIIHSLELSAIPAQETGLQVMMTTLGHTPKAPSYTSMEIQPAGKMASTLEKAAKPKELMFLSSVNCLADPVQTDQFYGAISVFSLPFSSIGTAKINLFLVNRDEKVKQAHILPNTITAALTKPPIDATLISLNQSENVESESVPLTWTKGQKLAEQFAKMTGAFEIGIFSVKDAAMFMPREATPVMSEASFHSQQQQQPNNNDDQLSDAGSVKSKTQPQKSQQKPGTNNNVAEDDNEEEYRRSQESFKASDMSESRLNEDNTINTLGDSKNLLEKWRLLSRELSQRQEIIHRMNKDIDEKTDSLKFTGEEITDLRKKIKVLRSDNSLLVKRMNSEKELEAMTKPSKEIWNMKPEVLNATIIKVATAYRDERLKNEEFDRQIKEAYSEIIKAKHSSEELENLHRARLAQANKLTELKDILARAPVYRETMSRQEKVILKLENAMEVTMKGSAHIRSTEKEMQALQIECENLQENLRNKVFTEHSSELLRIKRECEKLETINKDVVSQLTSKQRPSSSDNIDLYSETVELETKLFKATSKVEAFQEELNRTARDHAREIADLRAELAQKQAQVNLIQGSFY